MRSKIFTFIFLLISLSIGFGACVGSTDIDDSQRSSSAIVTAFGIDSIDGVFYKFSIDQLNHVIFNEDSLPIGSDTLMDSITIDTFTISGYLTSGLADTTVDISNAQDLTAAVNNSTGMTFKVTSPDLTVSNEYTLFINIHMQDPDTMNWSVISNAPDEYTNASVANGQRMVMMGNNLLIYTLDNDVSLIIADVSDPVSPAWSAATVNGLPTNTKVTSITKANDILYAIDEDGNFYYSDNGSDWTEAEALSGNVKALLAQSGTLLSAIVDDNFATLESPESEWQTGAPVPDGFPTENLYYDTQITNNIVERIILVGMPASSSDRVTPWLSLDGAGWTDLGTTSEYYCPTVENPMIIYYNDAYYIFGDGLESAYWSIGGIAWNLVEEDFALPEATNGATSCAVATDDEGFIWISTSGDSGNNVLYRGRMNKYGFAKQ